MELDDLHRLIVMEDQPANAEPREYQVFLDGYEIGELDGDRIVSYNMLPGRHRLELRSAQDRPTVREFAVAPEQHITRAFVRVGTSGRTVVSVDTGLGEDTPLPGGRSSEEERGTPRPTRRSAPSAPATPAAAAPRRGAGSFFLRHVIPVVVAFLLGAGSAVWLLGGTGGGSNAPDRAAATRPPPSVSYQTGASAFRLYRNGVGALWGQALAEVTNTGNTDLSLLSASYDLVDAGGRTAASRDAVAVFPNVLRPGETGFVYDDAGFDGLDPDAEYTVVPYVSAGSAGAGSVRYEISDFRLAEREGGGVSATGRVTNGSGRSGRGTLCVVAALYGADGEPLGLMYTNLTDALDAGETMGFEVNGFTLPEGVAAGDVADYTAYAYPLESS